MVGVKIQAAVHHPLIVIGAYRPTNNNGEYAANLTTSIKSITAQFPNSPIWVAGDLNLPDIDWTTNSIRSHQYLKSINNSFIDLASNLGMTQSVSFPTRIDNTLDVFLTNRPSLISRCEPIPVVDTNIMPRRQRYVQRKVYSWNRLNNDGLHRSLEGMADDVQRMLEQGSPVNDMWHCFSKGCCKAMNEHIPSKFTSQRFNKPCAGPLKPNLLKTAYH